MTKEPAEYTITSHSAQQWRKRMDERRNWVERIKIRRKKKHLQPFGNDLVDAELYPAIFILNKFGMKTEHSCAGVSILDEPEDHSLYAYLTLFRDDRSDQFVAFVIKRLRHRVMVTYEAQRGRYDISSFFIDHNRSFCLLLNRAAMDFVNERKEVDEEV